MHEEIFRSILTDDDIEHMADWDRVRQATRRLHMEYAIAAMSCGRMTAAAEPDPRKAFQAGALAFLTALPLDLRVRDLMDAMGIEEARS